MRDIGARAATGQLPRVGDEVTEGRTRAIVTAIRQGAFRLRAPGRDEWPAKDPHQLKVTRTHAEGTLDEFPEHPLSHRPDEFESFPERDSSSRSREPVRQLLSVLASSGCVDAGL